MQFTAFHPSNCVRTQVNQYNKGFGAKSNAMSVQNRVMFVIFVLGSVNKFNGTKQPTEIVLLPVVMISVFSASGRGLYICSACTCFPRFYC